MNQARLLELAQYFEPRAEIIAEFRPDQPPEISLTSESILEMLKRRPCSGQDIAQSFGLHPNEAAKYLGSFVRRGEVQAEVREGTTYYRVLS